MEQKTNLIVLVLAIVVIIFAMVFVFTKPAQVSVSTTNVERDVISVTGYAVTATMPDQVEIFVNIRTEAGTAKSAKDQNAKLSENIKEALKKAGLEEKEIETISYNIYPKYYWDESTGKQKIDGYYAENVLKITTKKMEKAGDYIDAAVNYGATINQVSFSLSREKQKETNAIALKLAAENAKSKATSIADAMGLSLGKIASISESNVNYNPRPWYDFAALKADAGEATEVIPGEVEVHATISVNYYIS